MNKTSLSIFTALLLAACSGREDENENGGSPQPLPPEPGEQTPGASSSASAATLPTGWHAPAGDLKPGTSSAQGDVGYAHISSSGELIVAEPRMRFPLERGPAFLNSQIFGRGGNGYETSITPDPWPPVDGQENDAENFNYPWRDNFCEVRGWTVDNCPGGRGHAGQDIRPATCENGVHWAVAPERVVVRNVANVHLVNLYGLETGTLYTYLHMDRPLAPFTDSSGDERTVRRFDVLERGARVGRVSDVLAAPDPSSTKICEQTGRCTTVHLHVEMRDGVAQEGSIEQAKAVQPMAPYSSLVEAYLDLVDMAPPGEDWVSPQTQPALAECAAP